MATVPRGDSAEAEGAASPAVGGLVQPPSVSLPKGGGAIRGIGEKFTANPVTGTGSLSIPIATSPGRSGFGPQLALTYDSSAGNGVFGFGWSLTVPSITRKTDKGVPRYLDHGGDSDVFILSGAEDLVPVLVEKNGVWGRPTPPQRTLPDGSRWKVERYRPRVEGLFARIERWTNTRGEIHWRSISKDNVTSVYGNTAESRVADPDNLLHVFSWLIAETYDDRGNVALYQYVMENSDQVDETTAHERNRDSSTRSVNRHLTRIKYGNVAPRVPNEDLSARSDWLFEVVFDYGQSDALHPAVGDTWPCRDDPFSSYRSGFEVRTYRLCRRVLMYHHFPAEADVGADCLVHSTDFRYRSNPIGSVLTSVTHTGYVRGASPRSLPPLELEYTEAIVHDVVLSIDADEIENLPVGVDESRLQWVDLDGEGVAGVLAEEGRGWYYKRNLSPVTVASGGNASFAPLEVLADLPATVGLEPRHRQLLDLGADGTVDVVTLGAPLPGFYERTDDERWRDFVTFESMPNVAWDDPNLRLVDLTGDGRADVLIADDCAFTWHQSLGKHGFAEAESVASPFDEESGPRVVFADRTESIHLADMSGDGLTDVVRIGNGEVSYWSNRGRGVFGKRVAMDHAPWFDTPELFDPARIRLADVDGSGVTDILYLGREGAQLYRNHSGNSWSDVELLNALPCIDDLASVQVVDLLGNGTACLVWSSPLPGDGREPVRYIDLMGGEKPHLLEAVRNNLGAETLITYAPSTRFSTQDRLAGRPWITRLPFPVHVVERVETLDRISGNRFVTRYAYHHGHFDGEEREFRGFGLVEQWDTEQFAVLSSTGMIDTATNLDEASHVPPVCTKTWFHTGAHPEGGRVSRHFESEYYREDLPPAKTERMLLADTTLPDTIRLRDQRLPFFPSTDEERQAVRTLKGSILRQEIYAIDGSAEEKLPYSVSERSYTIEALQPRGGNRHAVFFAHPRETVDYSYERTLYEVGAKTVADPRVTHALTLDVDDFGNSLRSVTAAYGRRYDDPNPVLTAADRARQRRTFVTYTENEFTNSIDDDDAHRAPLMADTRTYELLNSTPSSSVSEVTNLFTLDDFLKSGGIVDRVSDGSRDLAYETFAGSGLRRRLIEHVRLVYRADDLDGPLPLGRLQSRALPFEGYKLAFPRSLLAGIYVREGAGGVTEQLITDRVATMSAAGYVRSSGLKAAGVFRNSDPNDDWWIPSGRIFYSSDPNELPPAELVDATDHFFLPRRYHDAFDEITTIDYDGYDLLVQETRDVVGNTMTAGRRSAAGALLANGNDYRVLQPRLVTDANRNRSEAVFDALGLVVASAVMGKQNQQLGDSLDALDPELADSVVDAHLADPLNDPHSILQEATTRLVYDLFAYVRTRADPQPQPNVVYALARETHASDLDPNAKTRVQHSFTYSDGFGREIQRKLQAEPAGDGAARWVGSGWTVFNNKGKPVRQHEPYFSSTHRFELARSVGVSPTLLYDPLGRVRATVHPNHSYDKVVVDPWRLENWDVNDTVAEIRPELDPDVGHLIARLPVSDYRPSWFARTQSSSDLNERNAATRAYADRDTPTTSWLDALGRPFLAVSHNRFARGGVTVEERYPTRIEIDIEGNQRTVIDALGRTIVRSDFDMLGHRAHSKSMDSGERWTLLDALGSPVLAWDGVGRRLATEYDAMRRPTAVRLRDGTATERVVQRVVYGETRANPEARNLRGKTFQMLDAAGELTMDAYDFKGSLTQSTRRLTVRYATPPDWSATVPLESQRFVTRKRYDALNRPVEVRTPDGSVLRPLYNEAALVERVEGNLRGTATVSRFVDDIDYDAKGRRTRVTYSNQVRTEYTYEPDTFRLARLQTTRGADVLQDIRYTYDPVGNITHRRDEAHQDIFFDNRLVEPHGDYVYDAVYRLIEASGRERLGLLAGDDMRAPLPGPFPSPETTARYTEHYTYDGVGNIVEVHHASRNPTMSPWRLTYAYQEQSLVDPTETSNRLTSTQLGAANPDYCSYDVHGNVLSCPQVEVMRWDHRDQLQATARQRVAIDAVPETTYYVYDAAGQRVRKVTERYAGAGQVPTRMKERIYVDGLEIYREYDGTGSTVTLEREALEVSDGSRPVALVETRTRGSDPAPQRLVRFRLKDHLECACLELDAAGRVISYEEFLPFGGTAYHAVRSQTETPKRYRYTGKERDEESGLYYHGARYLAPWLRRWTSVDPKGLADGVDPYAYARNNPISFADPTGTQADSKAQVSVDPTAPTAREIREQQSIPSEHPAPVQPPPKPTTSPADGPQLHAWSQADIDAGNWQRIRSHDLPPAQARAYLGFSPALINYAIEYSVVHDVIAIKNLFFEGPSYVVGPNGMVIENTGQLGPRSHVDALPALANIALMLIPTPATGARVAEQAALEVAVLDEAATVGSETAPAVAEAVVSPAVVENQLHWERLTANAPEAEQVFKLGQDLSAVEQLAVIEHGSRYTGQAGASFVNLTGAGKVDAARLAEILAEHGWKGGHLRLMSCGAGLPNGEGVILAQQLSAALNAKGLPSVVSAPRGLVSISPKGGPQVSPWNIGEVTAKGDVVFGTADYGGIFGLVYF